MEEYNITYKQLAHLSIAEGWRRKGRDAIIVAHLRGDLCAETAAQALGTTEAGLQLEVLRWMSELGLMSLQDGIKILEQLSSWRSIAAQYIELIVKVMEENNRLNGRLLRSRRERVWFELKKEDL